MRVSEQEIRSRPLDWLLNEAEEGDQLSAGQIFEELDGKPLAEAQSRVIVPKRGKLFASDGSMKIAVIRPCVSRGKRLGPQKLPPIYEPTMLEKNAGVFKDWPMYMDHLIQEALAEMAEALKEAADGTDLLDWLEERSRSIKELGGRIVESGWDPELTFEDDEEYGFRKGGVVARCIPQDEPRRMLEADPGILQTSINAWPSGARVANASWDKSLRGMAVEGIRRRPMGSVDWVFRAGAGGRPLLEEDDEFRTRAVSLLESVYSAARSNVDPPRKTPKPMNKKLSEMTAEEARAYLKDQGAEHLIEALIEAEGPSGLSEEQKKLYEKLLAKGMSQGAALAFARNEKSSKKTEEGLGDLVTAADVRDIVKEALGQHTSQLVEELEDSDEKIQEKVEEELRVREEARVLERKADQLLTEATSNGFPKSAADEIRARYTITPSGVPWTLVIQEDDLRIQEGEGDAAKTVTLTAPQLVERRIRADIDHVINVLRESGAPASVRGFGPSKKDPGSEGKQTPRQSQFRQFLAERKILPTDPEKHGDHIQEMVREGAGYGA